MIRGLKGPMWQMTALTRTVVADPYGELGRRLQDKHRGDVGNRIECDPGRSRDILKGNEYSHEKSAAS